MEDRTAVVTLRIEPSIKAAFDHIAKKLDQTPSQMLRAYIRYEVERHARENAQGSLNLAPSQPKQTEEKPEPQPVTVTPKKPKKGQRLAAASMRALRP
jgi:hypothetical protein